MLIEWKLAFKYEKLKWNKSNWINKWIVENKDKDTHTHSTDPGTQAPKREE